MFIIGLAAFFVIMQIFFTSLMIGVGFVAGLVECINSNDPIHVIGEHVVGGIGFSLIPFMCLTAPVWYPLYVFVCLTAPVTIAGIKKVDEVNVYTKKVAERNELERKNNKLIKAQDGQVMIIDTNCEQGAVSIV